MRGLRVLVPHNVRLAFTESGICRSDHRNARRRMRNAGFGRHTAQHGRWYQLHFPHAPHATRLLPYAI